MSFAKADVPKRVSVTEKERNKLVKFGSKLGKALVELVTIVHPNTLRRWISLTTKRISQARSPLFVRLLRGYSQQFLNTHLPNSAHWLFPANSRR